MKQLIQVRRLRFVPFNRTSSTHLRPGDHLEVVKVKPSRRYRGRRVPERVVIQVARSVPSSTSEFDIIEAER
jgi:hypothetical protein